MVNNDPKYISLTECADDIFIRATSMLYTLREEGRLDVSAPLSDVLRALSALDYATLAEIDRAHGVVRRKVG